jgi:hypothetical protein
MMSRPPVTVTLAVAELRLGADAVMTEVPAVTPATGTLTEVAPARIVTDDGTVATAVLPELILTVTPPAGADAERVKVRFLVEPAPTERGEGASASEPFTETVWMPEV